MTFPQQSSIAFRHPPEASDALREAVALLPGDPLLVLPGLGVLAMLVLYRLTEGGRLTRAGGR